MIFLILKLLIFAHASRPYEVADLSNSNSVRCQQVLTHLASNLMSNVSTLYPGGFDRLPNLLIESGLGVGESQIIYHATREILDRPPESGILKEVSNAFKNTKLKEEFFVCATNPGCRDKDGLIVQGSIFSSMKLSQFSDNDTLTQSENIPWPGSPFVIRAILFPGSDHPVYKDPLDFVPILIHELTHVADTEKIVRWVEKNNSLDSAKRDPLFSKVVRLKMNHFELDYSFYVTFLEGRAYLADRDTRKHFVKQGYPVKVSENELALMGYNQIREQCGTKYLEHFGIRPDNFFKRFESIDLSN